MQQGLFNAVDKNHPTKKQKRHQCVVFKPPSRDHSCLLPPSLDELIGAVGLPRFIDAVDKEADTNRHKITWAKSIDRYMSRVDEDLDKVIALIDRLNREEDRKADDEPATDAACLSPEQLDRLIGQINERIKSGQVPADEGRQAKEVIRKGKVRLTQRQVYTDKKETLAGRNSMSNTDFDATAMMQKDGVSIKPGFNVGIATLGIGDELQRRPDGLWDGRLGFGCKPASYHTWRLACKVHTLRV